MTRARDFADVISGQFDLPAGSLDNASADVVDDTTPQLGGNLDTNGNDITFVDNDKAVFGAGSDLQIFHNGTDSKIASATGDLIISTAGTESIFFQDAGGNNLAQFNDNSDVKLYYNANEKLATSSSGIDVTGTAEMDTLSIGGVAVTATPAELNYTDGVTSNIQTQLNSKGIANTPVVTARKGSNQAVSRSVFTKITGITSSEYDSDGAWDGSRFTVPSGKAGRYLVCGFWVMNFSSAGGDGEQAIGAIYVNGSNAGQLVRLSMNNGGRHISHYYGAGAVIFDLSVGDYVEMYAYMQDDSASGTLHVIGGSGATRFGIMRIN